MMEETPAAGANVALVATERKTAPLLFAQATRHASMSTDTGHDPPMHGPTKVAWPAGFALRPVFASVRAEPALRRVLHWTRPVGRATKHPDVRQNTHASLLEETG